MEQLLTVWYKLQQIVDTHRVVDRPDEFLPDEILNGVVDGDCTSYVEYFRPEEIETLSSIADSLRKMLAQKLA